MDKKQQRNVIIIAIILLLLFFIFNKKPKAKIYGNGDPVNPQDPVTPLIWTSCDQINCSTNTNTPPPIVEAPNTDYLVGVDDKLKGDFKLYYWCCPYEINLEETFWSNEYDFLNYNNKKWAILQWQPYYDISYQGGVDQITRWQYNPYGLGYELRDMMMRGAAPLYNFKTRMQELVTIRNINYCYHTNPQADLSNNLDPYLANSMFGSPNNCTTCQDWIDSSSQGGEGDGGMVGHFDCLHSYSLIVIGNYLDGTTIQHNFYPFAAIMPLTNTNSSPLQSISVNFEYQDTLTDINGDWTAYYTYGNYNKIFNINYNG